MSKEFFAIGFFLPTTKHAKYDFVPMRHKSKFLKSSDFLISSPFSLEVFFIIIWKRLCAALEQSASYNNNSF